MDRVRVLWNKRKRNREVHTVNCRAPHLVPARLHFPVPAVLTK